MKPELVNDTRLTLRFEEHCTQCKWHNGGIDLCPGEGFCKAKYIAGARAALEELGVARIEYSPGRCLDCENYSEDDACRGGPRLCPKQHAGERAVLVRAKEKP